MADEPAESEDQTEQEFKDGLKEIAREVVDRLVDDSEGKLEKQRRDTAALVERLKAKWARSLKLTELFLQAFTELGSKINEAERPGGNRKLRREVRGHSEPRAHGV